MNPVVVIAVAVDQTCERREGQVETIGGVREQQRVAVRRLDGPEIVEFDHEPVLFEQRRP